MCDFCKNIYTEEEEGQIIYREGKYADMDFDDIPDAFIVKEEDNSFGITACSNDPYYAEYMLDIKYCPYCGRELCADEGGTSK